MNPFIFNPKTVTTVSAAKYVIGLYRKERALTVETEMGIEENLEAVRAVLIKSHPELEADLELLIQQARLAGHSDGRIQDSQILSSQFEMALPYVIRQQLYPAIA